MALGRMTAGVLQLLGLAGLIVCIGLAIAILAGRAWIGVAVGDGFATVDQTITSGLASVDQAKSRLTDGRAALGQLLDDLAPVPATSQIPAAVAARITQVVDAAAPARDRFVEARSQAQAALGYLQLVTRMAPNVELPTGISAALANADDRLTQIDDSLANLRSAARSTAGDVAAAATRLRDTVSNAADTATGLRTAVEDLQTRIADVHASVDRVLWIGAGALLLVVGYVALLNVLLIWLVRRARRAAADPGPAMMEATPGA
ncbi:MAG TPA: hypothetical protein VFN41_10250 [Candidatus Limnocylindrales bacterium]|nr:hypothetical protein [Candidatus Limnocylindrales bacterium]